MILNAFASSFLPWPDPAGAARRGRGGAGGHPMMLLVQVQTAAERLAAAQAGLDTPLASRLVGLLGIATMLGLAVLLSYDRKKIDWRLVGSGLALQALFGVIVLKTGPGKAVFNAIGAGHHRAARLPGAGSALRLRQPRAVQRARRRARRRPALDTTAGFVANTGAFFAFNVLPDHHLLLRADVGALLPRHHAGGGEGHRLGHAEDPAHVGRRDALGGRQHLPRADRGAAPHQAVREDLHRLRAQHRHGGRVRHGGGRGAGGLRRHAAGDVPEHRRRTCWPPA